MGEEEGGAEVGTGGAALAWSATSTGLSPVEVAPAPRRGAAGPDLRTPLFLPHLAGERAPLWDPQARGAFLGLDSGMTRAALAKAVLEGVALSARLLLEALDRSTGRRAELLLCGGGGFRSNAWAQIRADVLGRPLRRAAVADAGTLGAAALGAVAGGLQPDLSAALADLVTHDATFEPDPRRAARYDDLFALYRPPTRRSSPSARRWRSARNPLAFPGVAVTVTPDMTGPAEARATGDHIMKRLLGTAAAFLLLGGMAAAQDSPTVAVITPYLAQPGTQFYLDGFQAEAEAQGWEVNVVDTAGDIAAVISRLEDAVTQQVDAIVINVDPVQVEAGLVQAQAAGIPVIGMDAGASPLLATNVTSNGYAMAAETATYVVNRIGGEGRVVMFTFDPFPPVQQRGVIADAIFANNPDIEVIDRVTPDVQDGGIADSRAKMEAILAANPSQAPSPPSGPPGTSPPWARSRPSRPPAGARRASSSPASTPTPRRARPSRPAAPSRPPSRRTSRASVKRRPRPWAAPSQARRSASP
jgi:hypothetical protein